MADAKVYQSTDLHESHVTVIDGLSVTTPARTIIVLAKVFSTSRLERTLDNALTTSKVDLDELADLFATLARKGKPGVTKLGKMVQSRGTGSFVTESELEFLFLNLMEDNGCWVAPACQRKSRLHS